MGKYQIVLDISETKTIKILQDYQTIKDAKDQIARYAELSEMLGLQIVWTTGRRGFVTLLNGRLASHYRIETYGVIK